jgi:hypothetical protein
LGGTAGAAAAFLSTSVLLHSEIGFFGAIGGFVIGSIGGALATVKTHQVLAPAIIWGAFVGPLLGLILLTAVLHFGSVGM